MLKKLIKECITEILRDEPPAPDDPVPFAIASSSLGSGWVGKYVICRTRNEGINAGEVVALDHTGVVLKGARRLWYHKPKANALSWYEGVAQSGLVAESKASAPCDKILSEDYSLTACTEVARQSIEGHATHRQS